MNLIINLSPVRIEEHLKLSRNGSIITVNGVDVDLSRLKDGDKLPFRSIDSDWFTDDVKVVGNDLIVYIRLPLMPDYTQEQAFPLPLYIDFNGDIEIPLSESQKTLEATQSTPIEIDWSMLITKEMAEAIKNKEELLLKSAIEDKWRVDEMRVIADQLIALEDGDPDALPFTESQWRTYRTLVRAWKFGGNSDFPNQEYRPVGP